MKKRYRLVLLLAGVALFLVATGLYRRTDEEIVYGPVVGIVLGFMAGNIKRGIISGLFWRFLMPLYLAVVGKGAPDLGAVYREALANVPLTAFVVLFTVVGATLNRLTSKRY